MRTCSLYPKLDSPPPAAAGRAMPQPRAPIRYEPEATSLGRSRLRSSARKSDESSDGEEGVDVDGGQWEVPLHSEQQDYFHVNQQLVLEAERQRREVERQRREVERQRREAERLQMETERRYREAGVIPESRKPEETREFLFPLLCVGLVVLVAGVGLAVYRHYDAPPDPMIYDDLLRKNLNADIRTMRAAFPSQGNDTWLNLFAGIRRVLLGDPTEPSVFLLVYRGGGEETCACLARKAALVAQGVLGAAADEPLVVDGAALGGYADGRLVAAYGPLVERHGTVVLERLHLVPAAVARGLHAFCDTITPLVRKAVYIFTLDVGGGGGSASEAAQRGLYAAWEQLGPDVLGPLVARVMGGFVVAVEPEGGAAAQC